MATVTLSPDAPIGVFDSGLGGLSVLRHLRDRLPHEDLIYAADSANVPYGEKGDDFIRRRADDIADFLLAQGCKALVIACNTATAAAAAPLRERLSIPIIAMEPAVKPATKQTRNGIVGVLATSGTLASSQYAALLGRFAEGVTVVTQPCPGLADQVDRGELDTPLTRELLTRYMTRIREAGADTIVLGCTHYPFLRPMIEELAGPNVALIDTGAAVARHTQNRLEEVGALTNRKQPGTVAFYSSAAGPQTDEVVSRLWGEPATVSALPV